LFAAESPVTAPAAGGEHQSPQEAMAVAIAAAKKADVITAIFAAHD
jgi:hypothetical protein